MYACDELTNNKVVERRMLGWKNVNKVKENPILTTILEQWKLLNKFWILITVEWSILELLKCAIKNNKEKQAEKTQLVFYFYLN
jgi:hypothetical protein